MEHPNLDDSIFDDCWIHIFKQLSFNNCVRLERVSPKWKALMPYLYMFYQLYFDESDYINHNGSIFKDTSDKFEEDILIQVLKGNLNRIGTHLHVLDFEMENHECGFILNKDLADLIVQKAPNLVDLNLSQCAVTLGAISALTNLSKLKELCLRKVIYTEEDLSSRVKDEEAIKSLVGSVIQKLPALKTLHLSDEVGLFPFICNRNLTELIIRDSRENMMPADVRALVQQCPNLESLELYFPCHPLGPHLGALGGLHKMTSLTLWYGILTSGDFDAICIGCPNLETLRLVSIKGLTSCNELWRLRHLKSLWFFTVFDSVLVMNDSILASVTRYGVLEDVFLSLANLTDDGLKNLAMNCPNLLKLDINYIENISDEGVKVVLENCKKLEELAISKTSVGDGTMAAIGAHGSSLRRVDATKTTVTDVGIKCLIDERWKRLSEGEGPLVPLDVSVDPELRPIFILNKEELTTINLFDVHDNKN